VRNAIVAAMSVWCGLMNAAAPAAEGRVAEVAAQAPEDGRVARYQGARTGHASAMAKSSAPGVAHAAKASAAATREKRSATLAQSVRTSDFQIFDAGVSLRADRDGDHYHSEFRVRFDADVVEGDALVYARLYLRRVGETDWFLYHETDDFWIYGQSDDDDYYVTTTLDDGFPTSEYDLLIDLHDACCNDLVATLEPQDSGALNLLPLEEAGLDVPLEVFGYSVRDIRTTLLIDDDADGHYSRFRIAFDPDADFDGQYVYARIWVRAQGGEWIEEHVTEDFLVDSSGTADVYELTADWISGYPTAYYDVQIDVYDAATNGLAASAGSERPELSRIPLEDASRDVRPNPPASGAGGGSTTSRESGGGALTLWFLIGLAVLALLGSRRGRLFSRFPCSGKDAAR
jgi:hypothetical protein